MRALAQFTSAIRIADPTVTELRDLGPNALRAYDEGLGDNLTVASVTPSPARTTITNRMRIANGLPIVAVGR
ncbi:MAG: hypothetical protein JWN95_1876 [Frankiales bacterium]|nr:hypothetical protein [Frankiales bacterium]